MLNAHPHAHPTDGTLTAKVPPTRACKQIESQLLKVCFKEPEVLVEFTSQGRK